VTRPLTPAERQRLRTPANLWRALIPVLALVVLLVVLAWPREHPSANGVHVVDINGALTAARDQAGFPVVVPTGLSASWRPTSDTFTPAGGGTRASFLIGYVTPKTQYAEFYESNDAPDAVAAQYGPLTVAGDITVNGAQWEKYQTSKGRELLRHTVASVTVIVTGSADEAELTELAASFR
jgi:hypothetical protein